MMPHNPEVDFIMSVFMSLVAGQLYQTQPELIRRMRHKLVLLRERGRDFVHILYVKARVYQPVPAEHYIAFYLIEDLLDSRDLTMSLEELQQMLRDRFTGRYDYTSSTKPLPQTRNPIRRLLEWIA